ncbi:TetR/AcrR family transcriptional regulator [Cnuibacter physcomitrellae]|uniref:TetR/AcrR family transcriptional regulator n=1 Tax=Cnuibacter physcomitrellae TaxID=1619308 RepID=UPI0021758363|nr:TetR/AcrR family transcriptional regulator [Cnuibacter physcomitrellae]MCS5497956.1 TetR/AcrR family transcriptional regulator [Cnuibacter physcomitrellae]
MNEHRAGPVRSAAAREAILDATARLFHTVGYENLTIEGVAREAGVGKQTIYRWWRSRGALIAECLTDGRLFPLEFDVPDTGDVLADVESWLDVILSVLEAPNGTALMRSLLAAAAEDRAVGDHLGASLGVNRFLAERLSVAVRDGQLAADAPVDQLGDAILGAIIFSSLGSDTATTAQGARDLVRYLLRPA